MSSLESITSFFPPSERIASFKPYFFASLSQRIAVLRNKGMDIIRLDMGSPDLPPADFITDVLVEPRANRIRTATSQMGGTPEFRKACANITIGALAWSWTRQRGAGLIGSKEGLFNLSQVLLNPGDVSIVPDPGYPVYSAGTIIAGAEIYSMPLLEENHYLPRLDQIPAEIARRAKSLWLNYPNNPTGAVAPLSFLAEAVDFARRNQILVAHDAPYVDVCFDGYTAPSIMQVPGAADVAVEFNSLSKTYNMAGWRLGMVVGNPQVLGYLHTYKTQMDSAHAEPVFKAAVAALTGDQGWLQDRNLIYQQRRDHRFEPARSRVPCGSSARRDLRLGAAARRDNRQH
jgi:LL-diaminopimelate aminotransferase